MQGITNIDDSGLAALSRFKALRQLDLAYCWRTTDVGIAYVSQLPALAHLDIAYCWQVSCLPSKKFLASTISKPTTCAYHVNVRSTTQLSSFLSTHYPIIQLCSVDQFGLVNLMGCGD